MAITDPSQVHVHWAERFNARDLDGMLAVTADDVVVVPQPGTGVTGDDATAATKWFLGFGLPIHMTVRHTMTNGDVALAIVDWSIRGTGPDGAEVDLSGTAADVLRRDDDGWKLWIDNPFGTA
jgi:ketosteroid isomerase-like protein